MDSETKAKYMDIVKMMQENQLPSPDVDVYRRERGDPEQEWSGTEYNAPGDELEHFIDNIRDYGIPAVPEVGDTGEFGDGWVQITYFYEESSASQQSTDTITRNRAYKLYFQCDVSLIMCLFQEGVFYDDDTDFDPYEENCNFYDIETGSRDPSDESHGYFSEMSGDVEALEVIDEDDED